LDYPGLIEDEAEIRRLVGIRKLGEASKEGKDLKKLISPISW